MGNVPGRRIESGRRRFGGVTGFGAGLIVIDDPVKSRAEAESQTYRDNIWDWFNDDLYTRLEPDGAIILIQTRWHEDDLAGRLLREGRGRRRRAVGSRQPPGFVRTGSDSDWVP